MESGGMLLRVVRMLKKRLGVESIERNWSCMVENLTNYYKIPSTLNIPERCVRIGSWAFWCCGELEEVIMSDGIEEIGEGAFAGCWNLESEDVVIPESVKEVGDMAFSGCCGRKDKDKKLE